MDELSQQDRWLRRLVRGLVPACEIDEVIQATRLAELQEPPRVAAARRSWLARVARNMAAGLRRERERRQRLHAEVVQLAAQEAVELPSTEDSVQRMALQRQVSAEVTELAEPYRTALLQRFLHDCSYAEIAAAAGVSEANVRQRVSRGLDLMRGRMRRRFGVDWQFCLLPLAFAPRVVPAGPPPLPPASTSPLPAATVGQGSVLGVLWMNKNALWAAGLLGGLGIGYAWWTQGTPQASEPGGVVGEPTQAAAVEPDLQGQVTREGGRRAVTSSSQDSAPTVPVRPALRGRVLDPQGRALPGVEIGIHPAAELARALGELGMKTPIRGFQAVAVSDADGRFALAEMKAGRFAVGPQHVLLRSEPVLGGKPDAERMLVAAPAVAVRGRVVAADGRALDGVRVQALPLPLADFPRSLDHTHRHDLAPLRMDAEGRFRFPRLPAGLCRLRFERSGYRRVERLLGADDTQGLLVEMQPVPPGRFVLVGMVTDARGAAVAGARVGLAGVEVRSAADGRYRLEIRVPLPRHRERRLYAARPGWQTVVRDDVLAQLLAREGPQRRDQPLSVDLQFAGPSLSITGVVRTAAGWPRSQVRVALLGEPVLRGQQTAEDLALEGLRKAKAGGRAGQRAADVTGMLGGFELHGLAQRSYRLRVFDHQSTWSKVVGPIPAGTRKLVIQIPADWAHPLVSGRVLGPGGKPLAGLRISSSARIEEHDGNQHWSGHRIGKTDADGRFRLRGRVPRSFVRLAFGGALYVRNTLEVHPGDPVQDLVVQIEQRCQFRVDVSARPEPAQELRLIDDRGRSLGILERSPDRSSIYDRLVLRKGRSEILFCDPAARQALFFDAQGRELFRVPLQLVPGQVLEIR